MDQFTHRVEKALHEAQNLALAGQHSEMRPLHLVSAFSSLDESLLVEVCDELGALSQVRERLRDAIAQVPTLGTASNDLRMSSELGRVLAVARTLAEKAGDRFVPEE
ncbi:MAG: hypothetical protein VX137_06825, partial [Pseudomonadota bacterium]|nr:hypothetical protein [Pseudomonadota bacterium]